MNIEDYKKVVINHLRGGHASEEVWQEVAAHLLADSEAREPLKLDEELGFSVRCKCGSSVWLLTDDPECEDCGKRFMPFKDSQEQ